MLRFSLHYGIHFIVPILIGFLFFKKNRLRITLILLSAILIDLDHLLADPIFDSNRCSINFHPLHTYWAMAVYFCFIFFKRTRIFGFALLLHMLADWVDCLFIASNF